MERGVGTMKKLRAAALLLCLLLALSACARTETPDAFAHDYGVFPGYTGDLAALADYQAVVIDAQYYSGAEIAAFRARGHSVYSYLNVGSLETFRDYYRDYQYLALGAYEHWDEEVWIDVGADAWQDFILQALAPQLSAKGIDGFFVDNCDVYYYYPRADILAGLTRILTGLRASGAYVLLNGGDACLDAYCASGGEPSDIADGINQESVFTAIDWARGTFGKADTISRDYFSDYVCRYAARGLDIYLLEYTDDALLSDRIAAYCAEHGFRYYIAASLELDAIAP